MAQHDDEDRVNLRNTMESRRRFDEKIADLRAEYERLTPEERANWRTRLEKLNAIDKEFGEAWPFTLILDREYDYVVLLCEFFVVACHLASAASSLDFGVESFQFHAGVFDAELPIDSALFGVRFVGPRSDFSL